ncbi:MAG: SDR family NAD(P)-dependent oxidoreductase [Weeksellaceae bacterium]|jgi:NADP-dependent 3-hydroxy acid dehydrogenase YdfG|nr:SDR family NAD(P)-dependent oxidoreductase [Weeksellaceae bacterium]MDX9704791.1 SDR family NAD(P)-dependent oxidoreductase [Weeksellaceae bacterium]
MQLNGKTALLTGCSSGLGKALTMALIDKGVKVYGLARNLEKLEELKKQTGELFEAVHLDITDFEETKNWISTVFSENHSPDILINNAGIGEFRKIEETTLEDWIQIQNVNLNAVFYLTSKLVPWMKSKEQSSHIINIGSILGSVGRAEGTAYCASKFGIQGFSDALFKELRDFNIKVSCVNPGSIATDFFKTSGIQSHSNMLHPKDLADSIIHLLETPDNFLISEITIRPLQPTLKQ